MRTVGLELGQGEARAVIGEQRRGRWHLLEAAVQPLPADPSARRSTLAAFIETHARGAQVVVGLGLAESNVRLVTFPATTEDNLARMARTEAESHFGLAADSLEFGWAVVDPATATGEALVAVAVCRADRLRELLQPLADQHVAPRAVNLGAVALANLFSATVRAGGQATAILLLGDQRGEFVLLDAQGRLRQVRVVPPEPEALAPELRRSLQSHSGATGEVVGQVILCGSGNGQALAALTALGFNCVVADPWATLGAELPAAEQSSAYAVATGLMTQGGDVPLPLNLRRRMPTAAEVQRRKMAPATWGIVALLVCVAASVGWFISAYRGRQALLATAQAKVERLRKELDLAGGESAQFLETLSATRERVRAQSAWLEVLRQLAERLPDGIALEEWSCDAARGVSLRGQARGAAGVTAVMTALNDSGRFEPARLDSYDAVSVGKETIYNFQVSCAAADRAKKATTRAEAAR